jgi:hypothetical protein
MKNFYIKAGDQFKGPYTLQQLREMWKKGAVSSKTTYCEEGGTQWRSLAMMQTVLEQESSESQPDSGAHCKLRTAIYYALGIAGFAAIIVLLRSLAK